MVEDTLKVILETEAQAEEILKGALEEAKLTVQHAEEEAENIRIAAREKVRVERKNVVSQANSDSEQEYFSIIEKGKIECQNLEKETNVLEAAKFIKDVLFDNYGI